MTYLLTHTGKKVVYEDPQPDMICLEDIFFSLTRVPRFGGHTRRPYSVAEHCLKGANCLEQDTPEFALEFLLHDATEAYLGDVPTPLKAQMPGYKAIEKQFDAIIREKYGLPADMSPEVKVMDIRMLAAEKEALMPEDPVPWECLAGVEPAPVLINGDRNYNWSPAALIHGMKSLFKRYRPEAVTA